MTAIAGIVCFENNLPEYEKLERLSSGIRIFGKDNQSSIVWDGGYFSRALLHITREDRFDSQPLFNRRSRSIFVFDGRIDNRVELAGKLNISLDELSYLSDSDLAFEAVQRWGTKALSYFIGCFAIACWHPGEKRLWLARDLVGIRPLYWTIREKQVAFSSSAKSLFPFTQNTPSVDVQSLHAQLCLLGGKESKSFFTGIFGVQAGYVIQFVNGCVVSNTSYRSLSNIPLLNLKSDEAYVDALDELLVQITKDHLRSVHPISTQLSSGLDSSIVTYYAARELASIGKRTVAYTAIPRANFNASLPRGLQSDESHAASLISDYLGNVDHVKVDVENHNWFELTEKVNTILDVPILNASNLMWVSEINKRVANSGSRVLLTGSLGNLTLSYNGVLVFQYLFKSGQWLKLIKEARAWRRSGVSVKKVMSFIISPVIPQPILFILRRMFKKKEAYVQTSPFVNPSLLEKYSRTAKRRGFSDLTTSQSSKENRIKMILKSDLSAYYLYANSMGIEMRDPTADLRLIEFCLSLPEDQFCKGKTQRWLAKRLFAKKLQGLGLLRKSRGLQQSDFAEHLLRSLPKVFDLIDKLKKNAAARDGLDLERLEQSCVSYKTKKDELLSNITLDDIVQSVEISRAVSVAIFINSLDSVLSNPMNYDKSTK